MDKDSGSGWWTIADPSSIPSPALLIYPDHVAANIRRMLEIAGGPERLCPHIKTHKLAQIVRLQQEAGIRKFKASTIAEAELAAASGAPDVLLAYQPVGPAVHRVIDLASTFPDTRFSVIADAPAVVCDLSRAAAAAGQSIPVLIDIDSGMHRTGLAADERALDLARSIASSPSLEFAGLHVYDGHIHDSDASERKAAADEAFRPVLRLIAQLRNIGLPVVRCVAGGTPTFPIHALHSERECSPGTCLLWDAGYGRRFPDLGFIPAAALLCRVVSKPGSDLLCLDLGHKAVASENPHPRVEFLNLPDVSAVSHSEEHLVVRSATAASIELGKLVYALPIHICPTVALHAEAWVIREQSPSDRWQVAARNRRLTV